MSELNLIDHTAKIATAYVGGNAIDAGDVPGLITGIHAALSGTTEPVVEGPGEPAVSIRASVKPDHVTCLECGKQMKMLKRHLGTEHGLTVDEYLTRWQLPSSHPLTAPNYSKRRADLAKQIGLGRKPAHADG